MKDSRTKNSARNVGVGLINKLALLLFPFIIRTVMIKKLGAEYLGLNSLFTSLLSVLSLAELGFSSSMVYSMYKPLADDDIETVNALLYFYKIVYRIIGIIISLIGIVLLPFLPKLISGTVPNNVNIYMLYIIYLINTASSYFLFAYRSSILTVNQRTDILSKIGTYVYCMQYLLQIGILMILKNYYAYIIIQPIFTVVQNLIVASITYRKYPEFKAQGKLNSKTTREIYKRTAALIGNKIGNVILSSVDNIVISAFLGLTILAMYNNYYYIISTLIGITSIIYNGLLPSVSNSIASESVEKNYNDFKTITFFNSWIYGWSSICLLCLFQNFIYLWVGKEYQFKFSFVILLVIYYYFWKMFDHVALYKDAAGMWWEDKFRPYVASLVNLVINIILVQTIGINGVIISTILSTVLTNIPWITSMFFKRYFKRSTKEYYRKQAIYLLITSITAFVTYFAGYLVSGNSIFTFILKTIICIVVPNSIFAIAYFRTPEFNRLKKIGLGYLQKHVNININALRRI